MGSKSTTDLTNKGLRYFGQISQSTLLSRLRYLSKMTHIPLLVSKWSISNPSHRINNAINQVSRYFCRNLKYIYPATVRTIIIPILFCYSIEFDRDGDYFAIAGVTKKIKVGMAHFFHGINLSSYG